MHTLLVWEQIPEGSTIYLITDPEIDTEIGATLKAAHGKLMDSDDLTDKQSEAINRLNNLLSLDPEYVDAKHKGTKWDSAWAKYKLPEGEPTMTAVTYVYKTGWVL
jgi:hypothetical protein